MQSKILFSLLQRIKSARIDWKLAILFSAILPVLNLINNSQQRGFTEWQRIAGNWFLTFLFLLFCWILNAVLYYDSINKNKRKFSAKRIISILSTNFAFLFVFVTLSILVINNFRFSIEHYSRNFYLIAFRGLISVSVIYLMQYALYSSRKAQAVEIQNQVLQTENLRARFEVLRQQVNPHFLFNSLSTLRSMIYSGDKNAEQFVLKLSEVFRQLLQKKDKETTTLSEELDFLDDYCFMLSTRFKDSLFIDKEINSEVLGKNIPTFCLQILVENCIKHNIISQDKHLHIKIYNSGLNHIIVENNLQPKLSQQEHSGLGLNNLVKRYELLDEESALDIFSDETVFRVKIKLLDK